MFSDYEHIPEEVRLERICHILAKGIAQMNYKSSERVKKPLSRRSSTVELIHSSTHALSTDTDKIYQYLQDVGVASSKDIQVNLGMSRTTVYRCLKKLQASKNVVKTGETSAVRFTIKSR